MHKLHLTKWTLPGQLTPVTQQTPANLAKQTLYVPIFTQKYLLEVTKVINRND